MKLLGIRLKKNGDIIATGRFGEPYKLPKGVTIADVDMVKIVIPEINTQQSKPVNLTPEQIKAIQEQQQEYLLQQKEMEDFAKDNKIGLGDMVFLFTHSTGFRDWYKEQHGGDCTKCNERWASWNFFRFKGPDFLKKLIKEAKEKDKKGQTDA